MYRATAYHRECEFCHESFDVPQAYSAHKRFKHPDWRNQLLTNGQSSPSEVLVFCEKCKRSFASEKSLAAHSRWCKEQLASNELDDFYCPYCGTYLSNVLTCLTPNHCPMCGKDICVVVNLIMTGK